ncbi:hydantoinase/oxoprolinase family protein [Azorhizobium sp. AG788]|uniref:hydantoinase/oxoprolinase family protein n=1 Tax=Azorhizobium sp. AG788 TaxID=2183897 RepID=UPI00313949A8
MIRIGVDIGGTFTDFALSGAPDGRLHLHKQLTTPDDPSAAVVEGCQAILAQAGLDLAQVGEIIHGTTLVTNAVIERRGARTGMLVTKGFADQLDMGLEQRYDLFDLRIRFAPPVVARGCRAEIDERVRFDGSIERPLDPDSVTAAVADLMAREKIEALAICFLHAYANPAHEQAARDGVAQAFPQLYVSTSADVFPYLREYERWTTCTVNAYTQPLFDRYLRRLEDTLAHLGFAGRLYMMSSSGGTVTPETARRYPVRMLESGPAAGVLMAAEHARRLGLANVLAFDLGGTTAKGALVREGVALKKYEMEVARTYHHKRGSGLSLKLPVIDMTEIGSGGGSIANVDERGVVKVGPRSAGADPGPACYGRGGAAATLTDANLVLGLLDPAFFLGGKMGLGPQAAEEAIILNVAKPLGLDLSRAAWGIHEVVNEDIARAFRIHAIERGFDCRQATMIAFGGGGPIHATGVARKLRVARIVLPPGAGVMSALGLLASPLSFELARSHLVELEHLDATRFAAEFTKLVTEAASYLDAAGIAPQDIVRDLRVDARYRGQGHEIELVLPDRPLEEVFPLLADMFAAHYRAAFKVDALKEPIELVSWKVDVRGPAPELSGETGSRAPAGTALKGHRQVYLPEQNGFAAVPVYDRYALAPGATVAGPAVIEERESTCLLRAGDLAQVDAAFNLVVEIAAATRAGDVA